MNLPAAVHRGSRFWDVRTEPSEGAAGASADVEALEWLNYVLREGWPYVDAAIQRMIKERIEPDLVSALPHQLAGARFTSCALGSSTPVLGPVHVHSRKGQQPPGIEIDVGLDWACECDITLRLSSAIALGIKRLEIKGHLCLVLRPLLDSIPIVGGLQLFMISPPDIKWTFTGLADVADSPVISSALRRVVTQSISNQLVLPNRIFVHWLQGREGDTDITEMQFPVPDALLRLGVVEARGLDAKDWSWTGKGTSDPYAVVQVGDRLHSTPTERRTLKPCWGAGGWADFLVYSQHQLVSLEVFDWDMIPGCDDFIGRLKGVRVQDVVRRGDSWYPIVSESRGGEKAHCAGEVRITAEAFTFQPSLRLLRDVPERRGAAKATALLSLQLRGLRGLPLEKSSGAVMRLRVGQQELESAPSTTVAETQDFTYDATTQSIDHAAQRMAEFLATEGGLPVNRIAEISGLDAHSLDKALRQRPGFTTRWNQGFNVLLEEPGEVSVQLTLQPPGQEHGAGLPVLAEPFPVARLLALEGLSWEGTMSLARPPGPLPAGVPAGPFDVDVRVALLGLCRQAV